MATSQHQPQGALAALQVCKAQIVELRKKCAEVPPTNYERRVRYAQSELLSMKLERLAASISFPDAGFKEEIASLIEELAAISEKLSLGYVKVGSKLLGFVDEVIRLVGAWSFLALSSIFVALPCLLLSPVDQFLLHQKIITSHSQLSTYGKKFIASSMMKLSGVHVVIEGLNPDDFGKECAIVCFSHASTLDAFLITAATPVRALTMGKADLFLIPFFSWCLMAFGGVPLDRSNRTQAIGALQEAAEAATGGQCVSIAPEGTRSKSGNITTFKKGPFHMWEQLKTPIIPMVIYGAFDLFPPGKNISIPGKVYVRFLDPILPHEASSREEMSALVRTRMLEAWRDGPVDAAAPLTWSQRIEHWVCLFAFYGVVIAVCCKFPFTAVLASVGLTPSQGVLSFIIASVTITIVFYVYLMYISKWLKRSRARKNEAIKKSN